MTKNSYHAILRSSSIMGAASLINILSSVFRLKVVALLSGPAGVGLLGIYQSLVSTAAALSALGMGTSGTRQIARVSANDDEKDFALTRRALFWGTFVLAIVGSSIFFCLRSRIARDIIFAPERKSEIGWLAIGVGLTVMAGSQSALLNGLRKIGDLARIQVISSVTGTIIGVAAFWFSPRDGLLFLILIVPLTSLIAGHWYVAKLGRITFGTTPFIEQCQQWWNMVRLGSAFMVGGLVTGLGYLIVRTLVQRHLGLIELGHFQAAWAIGMTYLTFVLGAMGTDYYPRLAACISDKPAACRLVNEQTEIALLLAGPVIIAVLALAPWEIWLLYRADFAPAANILRWQLLGDLFKVTSWPLGFAILASGSGKTFVATESIAIGIFVLGVVVGMPILGVNAAGVAFLAMYGVYLPLVYLVCKYQLGFAWTVSVVRLALSLLIALTLVAAIGRKSDYASAFTGIILSALFSLHALIKLGQMIELTGHVGQLSMYCRKKIERII